MHGNHGMVISMASNHKPPIEFSHLASRNITHLYIYCWYKLLLLIFHGSELKRQKDMNHCQENNLHFVPIPLHWTTYCQSVYCMPQDECSSPALHGTTDHTTVNGSNSPPATTNLAPRPSVIRYVHGKQRHVQKGNNQARPQCPICNNTFSKPGSLKVHMRTHTGEKPFQCLYCSKTFNQSGSLISHVRTHTGERPFKCPFCEKRFTQSSSQKNHLMTHLRKTLNVAEALREARIRSVTG